MPGRSKSLPCHSQDTGKERLGAVVVMGGAQWPGANQESGGNNQGSSVGNIERRYFAGRRSQQPDQDDQGA